MQMTIICSYMKNIIDEQFTYTIKRVGKINYKH